MPSVTPHNIVLFTISKSSHPISVQVLHALCWPFGRVLRAVVFWQGDSTMAAVEFQDVKATLHAIDCLNDRDVYPGCCSIKVELCKATRLVVKRNDCFRWDYTQTQSVRRRVDRPFPLLEDPMFLPYRPDQDPSDSPAILAEPFPPQRYSIQLVYEDFRY